MSPGDKGLAGAVLIALVIVAILAIVKCKKPKSEGFSGSGCPATSRRPGSGSGAVGNGYRQLAREYSKAPYAALQNAIGEVRGRPDAKDLLLSGPGPLEAVQRSQALLTPEDLMAAERAAWAVSAEREMAAPYNVEKMTDPGSDTLQAYETSPAIDYQTMITDLVVDPRTRENHRQWIGEMTGWSGTTTMKVDILEPELYLDWHGLRMPQAGVGQYNPLQLTEVDDTDLAKNRDFRFQG
jgi:hypothetical protein